MKNRIIIIVAMMIVIAGSTSGQTRSIVWAEKSWTEILTLAKEQNKLIFLDAYTTWCGPCKWMAANMFTNDTIAGFYNRNFINAHFDMEKGEGLELARKYRIKAYPTLLFLSANGDLIHIRVGAPQKVAEYIAMAKAALTPGEGFYDYQKRFSEGDRDPSFIYKYLRMLQGAYMSVTDPLEDYFSHVKDEDLVKPDNWKIIYEFVNDINSREFRYLQGHQAEFENRYTHDSVYYKLFFSYSQALAMQTRSRTFSEAGYEATKQKILNSGFADAEKVVFSSELTFYQSRNEFTRYLELASAKLDKFFGSDWAVLNQTALFVLQVSNDTVYLKKAGEWAKKSVSLQSTPVTNDTYANIAYRLGDLDTAIRHEEIAIDLAKKQKVAFKIYEDNLNKFREAKNRQ